MKERVYYSIAFAILLLGHVSLYAEDDWGGFLPTSVSIANVLRKRGEDGKVVYDEGSKELKLEWLSVNSDIDEQLFDATSWDDYDEIRAGCQLGKSLVRGWHHLSLLGPTSGCFWTPQTGWLDR